MIEIRIHPLAQDDIRDRSRFDDRQRAFIMLILREMKDNPDVQEALLIHNESISLEASSEAVNAQKWLEQYNKHKRDIWRLKPLIELNGRSIPFRIIYAYRPPDHGFESEIWILGVFDRDEFDYTNEHPLTKRVVQSYEDLD